MAMRRKKKKKSGKKGFETWNHEPKLPTPYFDIRVVYILWEMLTLGSSLKKNNKQVNFVSLGQKKVVWEMP